jgi:hypothetical protein
MVRAAIQGMLPARPRAIREGPGLGAARRSEASVDVRTDEEAMRIDTPPDLMVGHP